MDRVFRRLRSSPMSRRDAVKVLGGAGLSLAGAGVIVEAVGAAPGSSPRPSLSLHQDATPGAMGTPAMVMPELGKLSDGTSRWHVIVGAMDMTKNLEIQVFMPDAITINAGDSIWFDIGAMPGFHTITFLAGQKMPPLFIPDPNATPVAGGPPPNQLINPMMAFPMGGTTVDGSTYVNSGVVALADPTKPIIYTFPKEGTFDYLCLPHQFVMKAKVKVQKKGSAYPKDQAAYDKIAADELAKWTKDAEAAIKEHAKGSSKKQADGSTLWEATVGVGEHNGRGQVFLPATLEIKVGDSVKWFHHAPGEPHTVTFVGSDTQPPEDTIVKPSPNGPPTIYQNSLTQMPQGGNTFDGKGYVNSGWLGIKEMGLPETFECKFTAAGDYIYYCALHGDAKGNGMAAKLKVTA